MSAVSVCVEFAKDLLPHVERAFNWAGYIPGFTHRISGGVRIVFGEVEIVSSLALSILVYSFGVMLGSPKLQAEGWKILDFAVHGAANVVRGFVEAHPVYHLFFIMYDNFVPEN